MLELLNLKRKIILRIIIILLPIIFICISVGIIVLLAKLEIIPSSSSSSSTTTSIGSVTVTMSDEVKKLIMEKSESEVWQGLTGGLLSARPNDKLPANANQIEEAVRSKIVDIQIPIRKWADDSSMNKIETTQTISVNGYLKELWLEFFQNVFDNDPNFVFASVGCFRIDGTGYGQIGFKSGHTYGAAVDINWYEDGNPYGEVNPTTKEEWDQMEENHLKYQTIYVGSPIVQIAHQFTLLWGGDWHSSTKDLMHFSFVCDGMLRDQRKQELLTK